MKMAKWNLSKEVWIRPLNLGTHDKPQVVKLNVDLDLFVAYATKQLLKEYVFVWMYKDLRGIPPHLAQHQIEFDTNILHHIKHGIGWI